MSKKTLLALFLFSFVILTFPLTEVSAQTASAEAKTSRTLLMERAASREANAKTAKTMQAEGLKPMLASREASMAGKMASGSAALREKLQMFKDKKKATIIERINENFAKINQRRSGQMMQHVDTLQTIASKAESRATSAQEAGTDISAVMTELRSVQTEISKAKSAVEAQSKKTYEITIASESGAKAAVKSTRDLLEQDLKSTHNLVKEARRLLMNVITKLGQAVGEGAVNATN